MKSRVLYASMILTVSVLLSATVIFTADAKTFSEDYSFISKGNGARIQEPALNLSILPIQDSKNFDVTYGIKTTEGLERAVCHQVSDKLVQISALKKASIKFNTRDAELGECEYLAGPLVNSVNISVNIQTTGDSVVEDFVEKKGCESGFCFLKIGQSETKYGTWAGTIDGVSLEGVLQAEIFKVNQKVTYWIEK